MQHIRVRKERERYKRDKRRDEREMRSNKDRHEKDGYLWIFNGPFSLVCNI
jgi:hypothetical protein